MLHKTNGIVLKTTDYSENSVVAKIYTQKFGLQSYLINGVKKPKAKIPLNMLQPLHLLDMVVYHKPTGNMQRIADARSEPVLRSIPYDMVKSAMVMFIDEMIYKSLKDAHEDGMMFEFIAKSIELLDHADKRAANFHLVFLIKLTKFLGFYPDMRHSHDFIFFDLKNGIFVNQQPLHLFFIEEKWARIWSLMLKSSIEEFMAIRLAAEDRKYLLSKLIDYYSLHIENFGRVKSREILEQVMS